VIRWEAAWKVERHSNLGAAISLATVPLAATLNCTIDAASVFLE
jgi:hypothetical protein